MWGAKTLKPLNPTRCSRSVYLQTQPAIFRDWLWERGSRRFLDIMEAEKKTTERVNSQRKQKLSEKKNTPNQIIWRSTKRGVRCSTVWARRRMNTGRFVEIFILLCFQARGNCILFTRLVGLLTHLGQYLPNWSQVGEWPPKTYTPWGRWNLLLRETLRTYVEQMLGLCMLNNCCKTSPLRS